MNPKQKASEIYNRCLLHINAKNGDALRISVKACAGICADEIMKDAEEHWNEDGRNYEHSAHFKYWNEVKDEITKI